MKSNQWRLRIWKSKGALKNKYQILPGVLVYGQSPRKEKEKYTLNRCMKIDIVKFEKHVSIK